MKKRHGLPKWSENPDNKEMSLELRAKILASGRERKPSAPITTGGAAVAAVAAEKEGFTMGDGPLGPAIPIKNRPLIKHKSKFLPDGPLLIGVWGGSGTGKTQGLLALLPSIANLDWVIVCTLIGGNAVNKCIKRWCESGVQGKKEFREVLDPREAEKAIEEMELALNGDEGASKNAYNVNEQRWGIVIYDDFIDGDWAGDHPSVMSLNKTVSMRRNYHIHSAYVSQSYAKTPALVRSNSNVRFLYSIRSEKDIKKAIEDFVGTGVVSSPREFREMLARSDNGGRFSYLMFILNAGDKRVYLHANSDGPNSIELIGTERDRPDCDHTERYRPDCVHTERQMATVGNGALAERQFQAQKNSADEILLRLIAR